MSTIFISHSSKDRAVAQTICTALEGRGLTCWIASRDVGAGDNFQEAIVTAIRSAKVMVLVFSDNANNSTEIKKELALASQNKVAVIPARVEDVVPAAALAYELATRQWINLFTDWESEIETLCERIKKIVLPASPSASPQDTLQAADYTVTPAPPAAAVIAPKPKAARIVPLWLALVVAIMGVVRLGMSSLFVHAMMNRTWQPTAYVAAVDMLIAGIAIVVVGVLLMMPFRWANTGAIAICIVALLHDALWLVAWYLVHSTAGAEAVVFHFGPIAVSAIACAIVLTIQIWRQAAPLRVSLGRPRPTAA